MGSNRMNPLSSQNRESELSYAYLHAVASSVGVACEVAGRHADNAGVDARLVGWGPFTDRGLRREVDVKVQLKATVKIPSEVDGALSYSLAGVSRYDHLRTDARSTPRILVVLFLPPAADEWITQSDSALSLHNCAYWVSLLGARASTNKFSQTVYLPKCQRFDGPGLLSLMSSLSRGEIPRYREVEA